MTNLGFDINQLHISPFSSQVITYFNAKLEQVQKEKDRTLAVNEVQDVIKQTTLQFPREKLTVLLLIISCIP